MAKVKTLSNGGLEFLSRYSRMTKVKHARPCVHSPSIGFEYEIPVTEDALDYFIDIDGDWPDWEIDDRRMEMAFDSDPLLYTSHPYYGADGLTGDWLTEHGYIHHYECGGLEVGSPVHYNIAQARATAKALIDKIDKTPWLDPNRPAPHEYADCGIHVHAAVPEHYTERAFLCSAVLMREESAEFLWNISGRDSSSDYSHQAKSNSWDKTSANPSDKGCVISNSPGGTNTLEFRFFGASAGRLLPAIEFAHAMTRWVQTVPVEVVRWEQHRYYRNLSITPDKCPRLRDFRDWLDRQTGYSVLRAEPSWSLVP